MRRVVLLRGLISRLFGVYRQSKFPTWVDVQSFQDDFSLLFHEGYCFIVDIGCWLT